ncbi:MAG TPA: TetR/AcrR family transcriptional regulator [Streptosporangiaceae bacterium]|jgi:AcrR family transcriptional regulator|nr:TetR/AcrR family transcriptional regulator [Streptosporangiaceae bacterium]
MLSRRDRMRAETTSEIKATARRILVEKGLTEVTLRAIAREMGMTAPALYRYFDSHEDLLEHVIGDIFKEIGADIGAAINAAGAGGPGDTSLMTRKMVAACREFRRWGLDHQAEFGLLFGSPLPTMDAIHDDVVSECAAQFSGVFFALFFDLWSRHPFSVPADDEIDPHLLPQLAAFRAGLGANMPLGGILTFLRCWVRLYGMVSLEVFGHLRFAVADPAPMFEITLSELADLVGLEYPERS